MKSLFITFSIFLSATTFAQSSDLAGEIESLAYQIHREARYTRADSNSLTEVRDQLTKSLDLLAGRRQDNYSKECFQYAYEKYYINLNSTRSTDKAIEVCKQIRNLELLKFAYERYYINLNSANAMDRAVLKTSQFWRASVACLEDLYPRYYENLNSANAMDKAFEQCH